ncbi:hypothetical protein F0P96_09655 [Hymenobacter busanensis]|uniref:Uncharacterized protein n=1 Tax=Hymenobacter busanensis TaxID=2607656 RepID=A0A7L5A2R8_9BACT|nr:hypothetical protein [Hymenobacter busanensis]KAA9333233.1 hypothetical protein F0P96_09655 [Hymenobacter busanensis]QHJ08090.1 hypothetical protein GUY19_12665 [Hymenobacter busanensis]
MKARLLFFLFACLLTTALQAQDLLTKRNGDEVTVRVLEVTPAEVRYKRIDNPEGPVYVLPRADVFMIKYANGTKDVLNAAAPATTGAAAAVTPPGSGPTVPGDDPSAWDGIKLSGPRLGFTVLTGGAATYAEDEFNLNPFLTQFGWQFETRLFRLPNGTSGLFEFVPLIGGLEQGKFIPSLNALLGVRGPKGFELGLGPNLTPVSVGIALAAGTTIHTPSGLNFPVNVAVVPGNGGARISLLLGFTTRRR